MSELGPLAMARLEALARARAGHDPAHDFGHVARVRAVACALAEREGARREVVELAALLHELFNYPKSHPDSARSGDVCAEHAAKALRDEGACGDLCEAVAAAIRDHSFSKGAVPDALEGKILQDADRIDALGAIGLARMWATCAAMGRPFFAEEDVFCRSRAPDDKAFGLDHVYKKLLVIPETLHTSAARAMAEERVATMRAYLAALERELEGALPERP